MSDVCPVCRFRPTTVKLTTNEGESRICAICAGMLEQLARLAGMDPKRAPALKVLR